MQSVAKLIAIAGLPYWLSACFMFDKEEPPAGEEEMPGEDGEIPGEEPGEDGQPGEEEEPRVQLGLTSVATGLTAPIAMVSMPREMEMGEEPQGGQGRERLLVVDQVGVVYEISGGRLADEPFLDLRDRIVTLDPEFDTRGLLGIAFHPDAPQDDRLYVYYSAPARANAPAEATHTNVLAEFRVMEDKVDLDSERVLFEVDLPRQAHNAGHLMFGPDGLLYLSVGDLTSMPMGEQEEVAGPVRSESQDLSSPLGKLHRFDVGRPGDELAAPEDNPFVQDTPREEGEAGEAGGQVTDALPSIYAYGFHNPCRFSFDSKTGDLLVSDWGLHLMEEVNRVEAGGNYGWNIMEGLVCLNEENPYQPLQECPQEGPNGDTLEEPVIAYLHTPYEMQDGTIFDPAEAVQNIEGLEDVPQIGLAVIGGYVYRGEEVRDLVGDYIFASATTDLEEPSGRLIVARRQGRDFALEPLALTKVPGMEGAEGAGAEGEGSPMAERGIIPFVIRGFGEDRNGELYVLVNKFIGPRGNTGQVLRLDVVGEMGAQPEDDQAPR